MKRSYEVTDRADRRAVAEFLKQEGQFLLPMVELVEQAVLEMSAEGVAGPKQAGRARAEGEAVWYGRQRGQVYLSEWKIRVERPRLRRRDAGGNVLVVTGASGSVATEEWWRALENPAVYGGLRAVAGRP